MSKRNYRSRVVRAEKILQGDNGDELIIPEKPREKQLKVQEGINFGIWLEHCESCRTWVDKQDLKEDEAELERTCLFWASHQWIATTIWLFDRGAYEGVFSSQEEEKAHIEELRLRCKQLKDAQIPDLTLSGHYGWEADTWRDEMRRRLEANSRHPDTGNYLGDWKGWTPERIEQCLALAFGYLD